MSELCIRFICVRVNFERYLKKYNIAFFLLMGYIHSEIMLSIFSDVLFAICIIFFYVFWWKYVVLIFFVVVVVGTN